MQILRGIELLKEIQIDYNCFSDNSYDIKEWYGNEYVTIKRKLFYLVDNELSIHDVNSKKRNIRKSLQSVLIHGNILFVRQCYRFNK